MSVKRIVLSVLTGLVLLVIGTSLVSSWSEPQVTGQLQLYQSNLLLQATEWQGEGFSPQDVQQVRSVLLGKDPLATVSEQYRQVREEAEKSLTLTQAALAKAMDRSGAEPVQISKLKQAIEQQQTLMARIDLRLGLLAAQQDERNQALKTWQQLADQPEVLPPQAATAEALSALWQDQVAPDAEPLLQQNLEGWFQNRALEKLYMVQNRPQALMQLANQEQVVAQQTLVKLLAIGIMPTVGSVLGTGLLIFLAVQWWVKRGESILAIQATKGWAVPWDAEIIWQVLVVGFFFVGQILIPLLLSFSGLSFATTSSRLRAIYSMTYYLLMATGGIAVLLWSIRSFKPLPEGWFRFKIQDNWPLWGWGGYLVALPLMIGVSILNQQFWQGQGGSNPLLQTVLEESDPIALVIFFLTAAVAAPLFEEVLFRGFLLPSLTRYMPVWGAIALSSFIFAAAHLSLSEVLPLSVLGVVLGVVYTRSRNLLAPMLLHSTWNSVTMVGLFLLGS